MKKRIKRSCNSIFPLENSSKLLFYKRLLD